MGQRLQDDLGVAAGAKGDAHPLQLVPQLAEVIDLAVEDESVAAVRGQHRLVAGGRQIEDGQAAESQPGVVAVVPAAGVLANDANPSGAPMSAVKKTDPALGSLSAFGADGAFSFVAPGAVVPPPFGIAEAWRNSLSGQYSYAFPVVGDVNDDGYPDMLLNHQGGTRAVDGRTGATLWNMSGAGYPDCYIIATTNAPVLADVDDDGKLEYVGALAGCERDSSAGTPGSPKYSNAVATSLSPRPDRLTRMTWSPLIVGASLIASITLSRATSRSMVSSSSARAASSTPRCRR